MPASLGTANTDWQDEIFRPAISTDHHVSINGGLKNLPYRVSLGYSYNNGILKTSNFQRFTASVNLAPSFFDDHLKVNVTAKYMNGKNRYADAGAAIGGALSMDPTRPVYGGDSMYDVFGGYYQNAQSTSDFRIRTGGIRQIRIRRRIRWQPWNRKTTVPTATIS